MDTAILERVSKVVQSELGAAPEKVTATASFDEDLGADSLDLVQLVMALEEEFGIEIPETDLEKISTVGQAVEYIETKS